MGVDKAINRILKRNTHKLLDVFCCINEQGVPDIHIVEVPEKIYTEISEDEGLILNIQFKNSSFSFTEKYYRFYVDEFQNYISLGSKQYEDHYIILEFQ